jgi:hypothetical protein
MKKIVLLSALLLVAACLPAQVIISLQLPPMGLTIKPQLWNLSLINTTTADMQVRVEMVMTDVSNNQRVLTGTSKLLLLPRGVKQLQMSDVTPITYNAGSPGYSVDASPNGFLPVGLFNICYTVIKFENDNNERLGEECETLEIEPISPPQLILPLDEEQLDITRPFFAWIPPSPYNTLNSLLYDWVLVEVQSTHSASDALQQNVPILSQQNVSFTTFQYPLSSPELDTSKLYAWRITAKNNMTAIGNSETWSFRVRKYGVDTATNRPSVINFSKLKKAEDAAYSICTGVLRFEYLHEYRDDSIRVSITDISDSQRKILTLENQNLPVTFGQSFHQMDLRNNSGLVDKHLYLVEVVNARQEKWFLKFEFRKAD